MENGTEQSGLNHSLMLLTAAVAGVLMLPNLLRHGMFMDGLIYSVISMNLANGEGTFWFPSFTTTILADFHDHPPLVFGIQSLFFRILGNGFLTERIYSLLTALLTAFFIVKIWRLPLFGESQKNKAWLPLLLWITVPAVYWSYSNNMLENTMGLFALASVWLLIKNGRYLLINSFLAGALILAGMLSKGFPAMFPIAAPILIALIYRKLSIKRIVLTESLMLAGILLPALLIVLIWPGSVKSIGMYLDKQVFASLKGDLIVVNRFHIAERLFWELLPMIGLMVTIVVFSAKKHRKLKNNATLKKSLYFFATGLSASLPIMISPKQLSFYLVPSMPYFAMSAAFILLPFVDAFLEKIPSRTGRIIRYASIAGVAGALIITAILFGGYSRDRQKIEDINAISATVAPENTISIDKAFYRDWSLMGYFKRYHGINLDRSGDIGKYHLIPFESSVSVPEGYREIPAGLKDYRLLVRNP